MSYNPTDEELLAKAEEIRRSVRTRVDHIKDQLCHWMAENISRADAVPATLALMELAIDARLVKERPDQTLDYVTRTIYYLAETRNGALQ
jgi:hypothetical protein